MVSFGSVVAIVLALPVLVRVMGAAQRFFVGAEGRDAIIAVETERPLGPMPQPWRALAQGGEELTTFLDGNTGEKIKSLRPRVIRFDHIYDGFNVVGRTNGQLTYNWSELDKLVDKITNTGAVPMFSLGYMPLVISKSDIVDEPKDYNEWAQVVQKTIEHYSGDKGLAGVYYEVWNEPDLFGNWKMGGGKNYLNLYSYASLGASRARNVMPFKFGGPATTGLYRAWVDRFLAYVVNNNLRLDFVSWHRYTLKMDEYSQDVAFVKNWLDTHPRFFGVELIISEMGPSSDKASVNDSMLGATHLLTVAREGIFNIKYMFNFSIKDAPTSTGGWGIVGKPRYDALVMLNRLGEQRLAVTGEGTYVRALAAQKDDTFQVLLINYDPAGRHSEVVPVTFMNLLGQDYVLKTSYLRGITNEESVQASESIVQTNVRMLPNTAALIELKPDP
jgi:xylan 1,4-beta-xylosidase